MTEVSRLRAPKEDGAVVAEPPLDRAAELFETNLRERSPHFSLLAEAARRSVLELATTYLRKAGEPCPPVAGLDIVMAGHQPELFHPGVWVKNFALNRLARQVGAVAVNLVVDNDTPHSSSLRVPRLQPFPRAESVPFDIGLDERPYEERIVHDEQAFTDFTDRLTPLFRDWPFSPLLTRFWPEVVRQRELTPLLGERFASARRQLEREWGCHNLEVPLSRVCASEPFGRFACHLLSDLPRFVAVYNESIVAFRKRYGLRSKNHPAPLLTTDGDWLEAPFWAWKEGERRRSRLFVRRVGKTLAFRAGADLWPALPLEADAFVAAWIELARTGFKVRSRALLTTLFARLFLSDLFIHGIGGGKYDEVTDAIIRRFYEVEPPRYLVLSATLLLPLPTFPATEEERRQLAHKRRDLIWNPDRHLEQPSPALAALIDDKQEWINREPHSRAECRERYLLLRQLNERLHAAVVGREKEVEQRLRAYREQLEANAMLRRRDYAFCLYPEQELRAFCTRFLTE